MTDQAMAAAEVDEDDFGAGFNQAVGITPEETETSAQETPAVEMVVEESAAAEVAETPPVDEWRTKAESFEQQAKDHQKAFTDQAMENADLKRRLAALEAKKPETPADAAADDGAGDGDEGDELFLDYAGAPKAIRREAEKLIKERFGDLDPASLRAAVDTQQAQRWESAVMFGTVDPETKEYVPGVSDLYAITHEGNKEYWDWYRARGYDSEGHPPHKAIKILNEFKAHKAESQLKGASEKETEEAVTKAAALKASVTGGLPANIRTPAAPKAGADDDSFEAGYKQATKKR